jgi:hypothetical protein
VIIIDDLDRCKPEQIVTILEAVNFLTSSGECIVLMGMEERRVKEAIGLYSSEVAVAVGPGAGKKKKDEEVRWAYANRYLEKVVGLWLPVPAVTSNELRAVRS